MCSFSVGFVLKMFGVSFVIPVTRHSSMAERLFARNRMWDVHRNLVTLVYRHDISSSQRVRDPTPTIFILNLCCVCCLSLVYIQFFDPILTHSNTQTCNIPNVNISSNMSLYTWMLYYNFLYDFGTFWMAFTLTEMRVNSFGFSTCIQHLYR